MSKAQAWQSNRTFALQFSSSAMVRSTKMMMLLGVATSNALNCGDVKAAYRSETCCGMESQAFDEQTLYPQASDCASFAFDMTDLTPEQNVGISVPEDACFYPVTLPALVDLGLTNYAFVPHSGSNEHAPSGAFVYKKADNTILIKAISRSTSEAPHLPFGCAKAMPRMMNLEETVIMGRAATCSQATISLESAPFNAYSNFNWVQLPWMTCGAFVYQTIENGPLMYHTCD